MAIASARVRAPTRRPGSTPPPRSANVLFFDRKPATETPWTRELWVYDLRTNMHFTLKQSPLRAEPSARICPSRPWTNSSRLFRRVISRAASRASACVRWVARLLAGGLLVARDGVWHVRLLEPGDLVGRELERLRSQGVLDVADLRRTDDRGGYGRL